MTVVARRFMVLAVMALVMACSGGKPIGLARNGWFGTEEFPLTERGIEVTQDPKYHRMVVHDVFADRPAQSGTGGPRTTIDYLE